MDCGCGLCFDWRTVVVGYAVTDGLCFWAMLWQMTVLVGYAVY